MESTTDYTLTLQTILSGQQSIQQDVTAMRGDVTKALTHLEVIDNRNANADILHRDFEARIRILEKFRFTIAGFAIMGGLLSGAIGYWIGHILH